MCRLVNSCRHDLDRGQLPPPGPDTAARVLGQPLVQRRPRPHRGELRLGEDVLDLVVVGQQPPVGHRVGGREAGHLLGGPLGVQPHGELPPVREGHLLDRVRLGVAQAVIGGQAQLVAAEHRVDPDHGVPGGAGVDAEPGQQQFLGGGPAAGNVPGVQHQAAVARLGQVAGREQAVVPGSGHHDVGVLGHRRPCPSRAANHCSHVLILASPGRPGKRAHSRWVTRRPSVPA